ncbi:hypothetical protein KO317_02380 [Candidatus Micrarchaeota archaeon]|jgi:hypothetical protein|nr:hypothetical protein [Candidatus Micrarchaeota archaeon]
MSLQFSNDVNKHELKKFIAYLFEQSNEESMKEFAIFISDINWELRDLVAKIIVTRIHHAIRNDSFNELYTIKWIITEHLCDSGLVHFFKFYPVANSEEKKFMEECMRDSKIPPIYPVLLFLIKGNDSLLPLVQNGIINLEKKLYIPKFIHCLTNENLQDDRLKFVINEIESNLLFNDFNIIWNSMLNCNIEEGFLRYTYFFEKNITKKNCGKLIEAILVLDNQNEQKWKIDYLKKVLIKMGTNCSHKKSNIVIDALCSSILNNETFTLSRYYSLDILYEISQKNLICKRRVMKKVAKIFYSTKYEYAKVFFDMLGDKDALNFLKSQKKQRVNSKKYLPPVIDETMNIIRNWLNEKKTMPAQKYLPIPLGKSKDNISATI